MLLPVANNIPCSGVECSKPFACKLSSNRLDWQMLIFCINFNYQGLHQSSTQDLLVLPPINLPQLDNLNQVVKMRLVPCPSAAIQEGLVLPSSAALAAILWISTKVAISSHHSQIFPFHYSHYLFVECLVSKVLIFLQVLVFFKAL